MSNKVYEIITEKIIQKLDEGVAPWHMPWQQEVGAPRNLVSGKQYRGVNIMLLGMQSYRNPYWLTFNQARQLGGSVRKGEKSTEIVFFKKFEIEKDDDKSTVIPLLRYYRVFNVEQCDLPEDKMPSWNPEADEQDHDPIEEAESLVAAYFGRPPITHTNPNRAFYRPSEDVVNMPPLQRFVVPEEYYSTLFHELVHSTGHQNRLHRKEVTERHSFGSNPYAREELVAEIGAAFLCGIAGIENRTIDNSAAYLKSWSETLRKNPRWFVTAAGQAQKAVDFMMQHAGSSVNTIAA
jgi:antirestriction protein ArdC